MNKFFKWFWLITSLIAIQFIVLLAYVGDWLGIVTWVFLMIASYVSYLSETGSEDDNRS